MLILHRVAFVVAALVVVGCSNLAPSALVPAGSQNLAQSHLAGSASSNANGRVLYVADIDGQPGLGQILVYTADMKNPQLIRTITNGTGRPFGLWVDRNNNLYAANEPNLDPSSVTEFKPGASSPFFIISNFKGYPASVAVDAQGNVYVNESYSDSGVVQVYPPGSNTPTRTIDTGVSGYAFTPGSMAFDPHGNLIVAEEARLQLHIVKIRPGSSIATPLNVDLTNIMGPGLGIDAAGNMYVASSGGGSVSVFPPGHSEPSRTINSVAAYGLTWVTPQGAVFQASGESTITQIAAGWNSPTHVLSCSCSAQGVAVSR